MSESDDTLEQRAREQRGIALREMKRARIHDFNNTLMVFACAVQELDSRMSGYQAGELTRLYTEALERADAYHYHEKPQGKAA